MPDAFAGNCLAVAELKQLIAKSDVVEWTDISAGAPRLCGFSSFTGAIAILFPFLYIGAPSVTTCRGSTVLKNHPSNFLPSIADTGIAT